MAQLPVVAAVPNYNMGAQLETLLPQLAAQDYAEILVLDDASTDNSREIVEALDLSQVRFIAGQENKGAGAARNLASDAFSYHALIHFIDADTDLLTDRVPEIANAITPSNETVGFIGGLALRPDGYQNFWNYGPRHCLRTRLVGNIQSFAGWLMSKDPERARAIRHHFRHVLAEMPDPSNEPQRRRVFWSVEQNLLMDSKVFEKFNFDERLREHEIGELANRMYDHGLPRIFDPGIAIRHKEISVRAYNRRRARNRAEYYIAAKKGGLRYWLAPNGQWRPDLEK